MKYRVNYVRGCGDGGRPLRGRIFIQTIDHLNFSLSIDTVLTPMFRHLDITKLRSLNPDLKLVMLVLARRNPFEIHEPAMKITRDVYARNQEFAGDNIISAAR